MDFTIIKLISRLMLFLFLFLMAIVDYRMERLYQRRIQFLQESQPRINATVHPVNHRNSPN